jgi:hypothetical protein
MVALKNRTRQWVDGNPLFGAAPQAWKQAGPDQ